MSNMAAKPASARTYSIQTPRRAPLRETNLVSNLKEDVKVTELEIRQGKAATLPKSLSQSTASSPARRVRKAIASPAKRNLRSRRSLSPEQKLEVQITSPVKRNLGSPVRKVPVTRSSLAPGLALSNSFTSTSLKASSILNLGPKSSSDEESTIFTHTQQRIVHSTAQTASPLKKPARRPELPIEKYSIQPLEAVKSALSPLKKPPTRMKEPTANMIAEPEITLLQTDISSAIDELSLPSGPSTPPTTRAKKSLKKSPNSKTRTSARKSIRRPLSTPLHDLGEDELAIAAYTPIQTPYMATQAQSPPSEETMFHDDDLWTPSVPLTLAKSFSELSLSSRDSMVATKQSEHTFFDDEGQVTFESKHKSADNAEELSTSRSMNVYPNFKIYVDCKSTDHSDSSEYFSSVLAELGAKTLCRWNWNPETQTTPNRQSRVGLTHVVFFGGAVRTLKKIKQARKLGIDVKCVGLSWVMQCRTSGRLTIGTEGHEVDVEAELSKYDHSRRKSMEPAALTTPIKTSSSTDALDPVDYLAPVTFGDDADDISAADDTVLKQSPKKSSASMARPEKVLTTNEFELRQLALVRRNSAKFRPPVSSPLSKKAWRA